MFKIIAMVGVVAGGVSYGMYEYTDVFNQCPGGKCSLTASNQSSCCASTKPVSDSASCCAVPCPACTPVCDACPLCETDCSACCGSSAKAAVGGVAMVAFTATSQDCCAVGAVCCEVHAPCCADGAKAAVAGSAVAFATK